MSRPEVGDKVRILGDREATGRVCTVKHLLDTQFTCTYEVERGDGGWVEVQVWCFYRDERSGWELSK